MNKARYTLREMLDFSGFRLRIKKSYSLEERLGLKRHLSSHEGACMIYDPLTAGGVSWLNERLHKHNMHLVQSKRGWARVVRLDDDEPLPENYYEIGERALTELPEGFW